MATEREGAVRLPEAIRQRVRELADDMSDTMLAPEAGRRRLRKFAEAAYRAGQPEWQPIETAPKDGRSILVALRDDALCRQWQYMGDPVLVGIASWTNHNGGGWCSYYPGNPTHWMPLPAPPAGAPE